MFLALKEQFMTLISTSVIVVLWEQSITQLVKDVNSQEVHVLPELFMMKLIKDARHVRVGPSMMQRQVCVESNVMPIQYMTKKLRPARDVQKVHKSIRSIKIVILCARKVHR